MFSYSKELLAWQRALWFRRVVLTMTVLWMLSGFASVNFLLPNLIISREVQALNFLFRLGLVAGLFAAGVFAAVGCLLRGVWLALPIFLLQTPIVFLICWMSPVSIGFLMHAVWFAGLAIACLCPPGSLNRAFWTLWLQIRSQGAGEAG